MKRPETIDETAAMIERAGGRAIAIQVDHTHEKEVREVAARIREDAGRIDVLVNSIWGPDPMIDWGRRFWEIDLENVRGYLDQTLISHLNTCRHAGPLMVEANRGLIVEVIDGHAAGYRGACSLRSGQVVACAFCLRDGDGVCADRDYGGLAFAGFPALGGGARALRGGGNNWRDAIARDPYFAESETPLLSGRAVVALAADPNVRAKAGLIHFASDLAREYGITDVDGRVPDFVGLLDRKVREAASGPRLTEEDRFLAWARYCQIHQDPARGELASKLATALGLEELGTGVGPAARES